MENLWSDGEALFFKQGDSICRYHISSNTLDTLVSNDNISYFRPITNLKVEWTQYSEDWISYVNSDKYNPNAYAEYGYYPGYGSNENATTLYMYNDETGISSLVTDENIDLISQVSTYATSNPTSVTINGKSVPLSGLETTKYFNTYNSGNSACPSHGNCSAGFCSCRTGLNRSGGDSIWCVGFAYHAYRTIWNNPYGTYSNFTAESSGLSFSNNSWGVYQVSTFFAQLDVGAMMIAQDRGGTYTVDQHAFVVTHIDGNGVWLYHANVGGNCKIAHTSITYENLVAQYESFGWVFDAP